jgi:hypothetical protein
MEQSSKVLCIITLFVLHHVLECPGCEMSPRVHGDDLVAVAPLRERAYTGSRFGVGEIGPIQNTNQK